MLKKISRILLIVLVILILLGAAAAGFGPILVRNKAVESFPQVEGEIQVAGLDGPVDVYRDSYGIPHVYASTHHDLFFAQGFVHAQDRFWQMDFWRHQGAGRLSELLGKSTLETDKFLRTLGWERVAKQELELLDEESYATLVAYSAGVNAYLAEHQGPDIALEYAFLPLLNRGYEPSPWTPLNSLTWAKAMAWDLRGNLGTEIDRAMLLKTLTPQQVEFLYPAYPEDHPVIVPAFDSAGASLESALGQEGHPSLSALMPLLAEAREETAALDALSGGGFEGIGSNSWAISGELTATGQPLLANDPHLGAQMPSIWYEVGLHCMPKTEDCRLDVAGYSFAGTPGVVIGHNDRIAWGFTNVGPDVMDLYIEKINPENPNQYEYEGEWVDMEVVVEEIQVGSGKTIPHTVRITRHGPIITDVYGLETFAEDTGVEVPEHYALALRWTALEPSCVFCAIWEFNLARGWEDFREAASNFAVPAQNLVYADVEGNIAYQMPGNIPLRAEGHEGTLPVPGWTGEYEWQGYIPFEEQPYTLNPAQGYIVTANNAVVDSAYPYTIAKQWSYGYRAQRIVDLLESAPGPVDVAYIQSMQGDNKDLMAEILGPILLDVEFSDGELEEMRDMLAGWDYQMRMDSAPAALYAAFWRNLVEATYADDLPEFYSLGVSSRAFEVTRRLVAEPENAWWDDQATEEVETRADIFRQAFAAAVKEMRKSAGKDPAGWAWGDLHTITFPHQVMNAFPFLKTAFNRGPYPTSGGNSIVNAVGWDPGQPYVVDWLPSMRMIVDFSDLTRSLAVNTTGQSGHPYHPHYMDMVDLWRDIQYHPMLWAREDVEADAEGLLRLEVGD
ncbi:MAG: Acyl-homoserine lactone acylase QuiP [Chloroflexi bacterium]|nr:Acyl-homoserine lactone acylase QuiP [Chloroflexota bacterium]